MIAMDFGCLPMRLNVTAGDISITTRTDFAESMRRLDASPRVHDGWMYPTLPTKYRGRYRPFPFPQQRYTLPLTHALRHDGTNSKEQAQFLISATGFLLGFRLIPIGHGYLQRTPMKSGLATDLTNVDAREIALCLPHVDATWTRLSVEQRQAIRAVITAYQTALAYRFPFEQFTFLYSALDAIWRFHWIDSGQTRREPSHSGRPIWLCTDILGIPVPTWAQLPSRTSGQRQPPSAVARTRNRLTHEAVYEDEPLGYRNRQGDLLDVQALVSRAIIKALGIPCGYVSSAATSQQAQGLGLIS